MKKITYRSVGDRERRARKHDGFAVKTHADKGRVFGPANALWYIL